jgi:hypothetical protein
LSFFEFRKNICLRYSIVNIIKHRNQFFYRAWPCVYNTLITYTVEHREIAMVIVLLTSPHCPRNAYIFYFSKAHYFIINMCHAFIYQTLLIGQLLEPFSASVSFLAFSTLNILYWSQILLYLHLRIFINQIYITDR